MMRVLDKRWNCYDIDHNDRYIATFGSGISVWDRFSLTLIHHFTGLRWIHGGFFVNDDVLMTYTGEQKLFFFSVSQKKLLWAVPRPKVLDSNGDMRCCKIPGTEKAACIAYGKWDTGEMYFLVADWRNQELSVVRIPDSYRPVINLVCTPELGLTFLTTGYKRGSLMELYRIHQVNEDGSFRILLDGECEPIIKKYSGNYLFMRNRNSDSPEVSAYPLKLSEAKDCLQLGKSMVLPFLTRTFETLWDREKKLLLPDICWVDENSGLLAAAHRLRSIGIYDFRNGKLLAEFHNDKVYCGRVLDNRFYMGLTPGFAVETFDWK